MWQWILANWQPLLIAVLAIDSALIPVFPQVGLLKTLQTIFQNLTSAASPAPKS